MNIDEAIMYAIKTSHAIKDEKKEQLTDYFCQIQQENKKYKEVINKAIEQMESWYFTLDWAERDRLKIIVEILKEVEDK